LKNNIIGNRVDICETSKIDSSELKYYSRLKDYVEIRSSIIGEYSSVSQFSLVNKSVIGKFCSIGHGCYIGLWEHDTDVSTHPFPLYPHSGGFVDEYTDYKKDRITTMIGNDVWIGAGAIVKKGVNIGNGAIIGAGSIVTKDVKPYSIVVGNPAKHLKYRFSEEDVNWLQNIQWWNFNRDILRKIINKGGFESIDTLKLILIEEE